MILDAFAIFYRLNIIRYYDVYDESPLIQPAETAPLVSDEVTA
jgi:hypothetical protein